MQNDLIIINDYCTHCNIEPDFILMLGEDGLIDIEVIDDTSYFPASQLNELERYTHLYYDLSINIEGIDAIWKSHATLTPLAKQDCPLWLQYD